jgi:hypothetical protein
MDFGRGKTTRRLFLFGTFLGVFFALFVSNFSTVFAAAGINQQINFQGRLLNSAGATVPDGFYNIQFKVYQDGDGQSVGNTTGSPAGTLKWTENYLNNASQGVKVQNGFLSVQLGSVNAFGSSIDWNQSTLWLSMNIGSTNGSCTPFSSCTPDGEMIPMQAMTTAVYALNALQLGGLTAASFGQLAANQTWTGINTYRPASDATNVFQLQKSTTGIGYITADSTNTQLVLGTASSLTGKLAFATVGGGTLTVNPTSSASSFTLTLPAETGTVCTTAAAGVCSVAGSGFVQLAPLAVQADGTNNNTIFVNKTSGTGNIIELQKSGSDVFTIGNTGNIVATGTYNSNAFNSTTLTFGGASPTISPSTTNSGLTAQANGNGTLTLNTGGTGTVNVGTTNTTTVGIGSLAATLTLLGTANINTSGSTNTSINTGTNSGTVAIGNSASTTNIVGATNINTTGSTTTTVGSATSAIALQGATTVSAAGIALTVTNDATIGRLGVNTSTFGTVEKFGVNAATTMDNAATAIISTGNLANKALVLQAVASQSANVFEVQNSLGSAVISATAGGSLTATGTIQGANYTVNSGVSGGYYSKNYTVGTGGVTAGDVVVLANDGGNSKVLLTTTARDIRVFGVATATNASGGIGGVAIAGNTQVTADTGAVAIGDQLVTSTTAGQVMVDNNATTGILGTATTTKAGGSSGLVGVSVRAVGGVVNPNFQAGNLTTTGTITSGLINGQTISATANLTGTLAVAGIITATSLGAANTDNVVCRNSTNQLATCNSTFLTATNYTLQGAYNNSTNPEIVLNATNGGLTLRNDATNSITGNLLEVQDNAGTTTFLGVSKTAITATLGYTQTGTGANTFSGATTLSAAGTALTVTNDATIGRLGVNTSTFGTVQKFGIYTPAAADNNATAIISTGNAANKALVLQAVASQSANVFEVQSSTGTAGFRINDSGSVGISGSPGTNSSRLYVGLTSAGNKGITVNAASGQTASLIELRDSSNAIMSLFGPAGNLGLNTNTAPNVLTVNAAATADSLAQALISTGVNTNKGLVVQGVASQSGDLFEAQDSNANILVRITSAGHLGLGGANASSAQLSAVTDSAATIGAILKGSTSQSADLLQIQDSTGASILRVDASGDHEQLGFIDTPAGGFGTYGNLITFSAQLENAAWTYTNVTTPTSNTITDPQGTTLAESLATTSSGGNGAQVTATAPTNANYTFSVWLKAPSGTQSVDLRIDGSSSGTGTVKTVIATTTWQRFSVTQNTNGFTGFIKPMIFPGGTGGSGTIHAWGAQLLLSSTPGVYTATGSGIVAQTVGAYIHNVRVGQTLAVGSTLTVTSTSTLNGNLLANADTTIGDATTDRLTIMSQLLGATPLVFQGATDNSFTTGFTFTDPTANRTFTFGDETGTVCTNAATGACTATGGFVQLQATTPGTQQTGNLNISGTGVFATALGINNTTPANKLSINTATTADSLAQALISTGGASNKALVLQGVNSQTANVFQVQDSGGNVGLGATAGGALFVATTARFASNIALSVSSGAAANIAQAIRGQASQTGDLLQFQDSTGVVSSLFNASGYLGIGTTTAPNKLNINSATTADSLAQALISSGVSTNKGLVVQGVASQSANLIQAQDSTGSAVFTVSSNGGVSSNASITTGINFNLNAPSSTTAGALNKLATAGTGGVTANDVVVLVDDSSNARVLKTTTARDSKVYGVAQATATSGNTVSIAISGSTQVTADTGAVAIGDQLVTSTTSGQVMVDNNATTGILGVATTAKAGGSSGLVGVSVRPVNGVVNPNLQAGNLTTTGTITSGLINGQTISATANFTGTLAVAGIITATSLGTASNDNVVCRNGTNQLATCNSTFVGTTAYTLQGAYTNSTNPEIVLNPTNGGLTLRNDSTNSITGNLLEVQDNAGTTTFLGVSKTAITTTLGYTQTGTGANTFSGASSFTLASGTGLAVTANATVGGTINTNTLTALALTFSGASPVISASTTNTALTVQSNGNGTLTLNSTGTGTVNVGTTNTTTIGIGNSAATTTLSGILNLNNGGTAATTIGQGSSTAGTILIQGGVSSSFSATNATGTTKLAFAAPSTAGTVTFQLPAGGTGATTYDICTTMSVCAGYGASTGANQSLNNLSAVAINTSLLPGVTNSINVGSTSFTFANGYFGTGVQTPLVNSGDTSVASTASAALTLRSGNATGTGGTSNSGAVTLKSGNSTNGTSGAVNIDSGTGSGGVTGAITIGDTNSTSVTVGNTGANTTALIQGGSGSTAIQLNQGLGGTISIGTTGTGSNVQVLCGVIAGSGCGFAANATDHSTTIGSTTGTSATTVRSGSGGLTLTGNISAAGTYNGNTFSSTALTFSGVAPIISASTTNSALTVQSNGNGTLTLNTTGAGTVNLGTASSTVLGIGNSGSANTILGASTLTGIVKINDTGTAATTIGQGTGTSGIINIQGGAGSTFSVTNTSGKTVLAMAAPSTAGTVTFQLPAGGTGATTYDICTTLTVCTGYASSASANTALSNLASVAINTSLLPGVTNSIDLGSTALTFANGYFANSVTSPTVTSGDTTAASSPSAAFALRSGNTAGAASSTGAVTFGSGDATTGNSGSVTIDSGTAGGGGTKGAVSLGAANTTNLTVGNTGSTTTTSVSGGTTLSLQAAASGSISIGTTNANAISIGSSANAGNSLSFGNSTNGETVNIENGATASGSTTVAILSGAGVGGTATLSLGNNTRVTSISLGNINPAAARTIAIGNTTGTGNGFVDTLNIATNPTTVAGGNTVHIADGTPTGSGSNLVTIGSLVGNSTTIIQGGNTANGIQITQGTGGGIIIGSANTASTVTVQCGAGTSSDCGFGTNGNDHSTYVGSTTTVSNTVIQSGTGGINLNGAVTTNGTLVTGGTINTNTFTSTALTLSGASPVISSSTSGTTLTLQSTGAGILNLNNTGAGTVNVGTTGTTTIGIGNASSTNTILGASTITGTVLLNSTGTAATTIGQGNGTAGVINIQGGAGSTFSVTNTSGKSVLAIAAPNTAGTVTYQLPNGGVGATTYDICTTLTVCTGYGSSNAATRQLDNLTGTVAINLSLLPGVTNNIDVGSAAKTFLNGYFSGIVSAPTVSSGDTTAASSPSAAFALRSGNTAGASSNTGAVTLGSGNATTGNSGAVTIDSGTAGGGGTKGAVSIGAANTASLILGNSGATTATSLLGGTTLSLQTAASGSISLGTTNASSISIGNASNSGNSISLGNSTTGETINIENGATASGSTTVAILSGAGVGGTASLSLGNNTRVTSISMGNINPAAARTIAIGNTTGTANGFVDTINIATNPTTVAGGNTVHIADGTPTGAGTNLVTIGSLANGSTTIIQGGTAGSGIQLTQGTGGNITIGSANTASTVTVQCGAGTSVNCGFGTNGNDHRTYVGSTTGNSLTTIQSGTDGISLTGAVVTTSTINTNTFNATTLTFSGASPVIGASTTNTGITLQSNGTGTAAVDSGAALGTVNIGNTNAKFVNVGNTTSTTQTTISGGTGVNALGIQVGSGGTLAVGTAAATTLNVGNITAATVTSISGGTNNTTGALNLQVGNGGIINIGTTTQTSVLNLGNTTGGTTLINGNTSGTAIQLLQGAGGTVTVGGTGAASNVLVQCGAAATSCNFGTNATDHTTTIGSTTTASLTTIQAGTAGIGLAESTTLAANKSLTMASGTGRFIQGYTGTTTDAHSITANSLTTGSALSVTSTNNSGASATAWSANKLVVTNLQGTTAAVVTGLDVQFTQSATIAGNTESVANFAIAASGGSPTDNTVDAIVNIANNDTATGNLVNATDGLRVTAGTANNIINGISLVGTFQTSLITSGVFNVAASGLVTSVGLNAGAGNITQTAGSTISAGTGFKINGGAATTGNYLRGDGTNFVSSALQATDGAGLFLRVTPASTADNTVALTGSSNIDGLTINNTTTSNTVANGINVLRNGTGGTTTNGIAITNTLGITNNGLAITQNGGTLTNGILFTGTIGTDITTAAGRNLLVQTGTTGQVTIDSGTTGQVNIGTGTGSAKTIQIGPANTNTNTTTVNIGTNTSGIQAVQVGSANNGSTVLLQGGNVAGAVSLQTVATGSILIGTTTSNIITVGSASQTGTSSITVGQSGVTNTITVGSAVGNTFIQSINIGTSATAGSATTLTAGSLIGASATNIQGGTGTGAVSIQAGASGTISVGTAAANNINIGAVGSTAAASTVQIATSTGAIQTVTIGSTNSTSSTAIQSGSSNISLTSNGAASGTLVKSNTNSSVAFQLQNAAGVQLLNANTTNLVTDVTGGVNNNEIANGSFETGTTGWVKMGASQVAVAQDNTLPYIGNSSLKILTTATAADGAKYNLTTSTLVANTKYTFTLAARTLPGTSMATFEMGYNLGTGGDVSCLTAQTVVSSGWTSYICSFTVGTTTGTPYVYAKQTDATVRTFYIDAVSLTRYSLLSNASAEQTLAAGDWVSKSTATASRVITQFQDATAAVKIVTVTNALGGVKHNETLNDSTQYNLSFYALLDISSTALTTMEAGYSSDGINDDTVCMTNQTVTQTGTNTGWTQYSCSFTTPSSHSGTPYFYVKGNVGTARTFYIDNVQLTLGNPLNTYQEGTISLNGTITSPLTIQGQTNSTDAFNVQNTAGVSVLGVDTINGVVSIGVGGTASSGLKFNGLNSASTGGTSFTGILGLDTNGNVGLSQASVSLTSPALAYWDGCNNPTTGAQSYPLATLSGTASYVGAGVCNSNGVQLTPATNTQSGSVNWNFSQVPFEEIQFQYKAGGGTGADGTWFYSYADATPTTEYGTGLTKGYIIYFSEFHDCIGITYGGYTDGNQCGSGGGANPLTSVSKAGLDDNAFHDVDIQILFNKIIVRFDNEVVLNYSDVYTRDTSALNFGFGARTGGSNNAHYIRNLLVTKLGTNTNNYNINSVSPIAINNNTSENLLSADSSATSASDGKLIVGSPIADADQTLLQLDSFTTFADTAGCTVTSNQGAMYYNSNSAAIRGCVNGTWEDVVTTSGLGLITFGVIPDSGTDPGDLVGTPLATPSSGPCKVYQGSTTTSIRWTDCTVYSGGRKVVIPAQATDSATSNTNGYRHLCVSSTGTLSFFAASQAADNTAAGLPTFSASAPVACMATVLIAGNVITRIFDTRTFTTSTKQAVNIITTGASIGWLVTTTATHGSFTPSPATAGTGKIAGVVVATAGGTTANTINAIIATAGPAYIKGVTGGTGTNTINDYVRTSATLGYGDTTATVVANYGTAGIAQSIVTTTCSGGNADTCRGSIFTILNIR